MPAHKLNRWDQIVQTFQKDFEASASSIEMESKDIEIKAQRANKDSVDEDTDGIDNVLSGATPGRETKDKTKQWDKSGGYEKALEDYNRLNPKGSREIQTEYGSGQTGTLSDGSKVNVRPGSTYGNATLEIQKPNGTKLKIRYGD